MKFMKGKLEKMENRKFLIKHIICLFSLLTFVLLSAETTGAKDRESITILIDLSRSTLCKDYSGITDFQKNINTVTEIINQLERYTHLRILAITENSFGKTYSILEDSLSKDEGAFKEKLTKQKLGLIEK